MRPARVLVLDFGSQYNQLIVRAVPELGVYAELRPAGVSVEEIRAFGAQGVILSGGPASVYDAGSPRPDARVWEMGLPLLGICYGLQVMVHELGGRIEASSKREYGRAHLEKPAIPCALFTGLPEAKTAGQQVWMSHGDSVTLLPPGFEGVAATAATPHAVVQDARRRFYGLQFHPEVHHTENGAVFVRNFLRSVCGLACDWRPENQIAALCQRIQADVGRERVVLGFSGGVDSSVMAALLERALPQQVHCVFIDNGLLRFDEAREIQERFHSYCKLPLRVVDAGELFLSRLRGVLDPEAKRKAVGAAFIEAFEGELSQLGGAQWLAQGTIYPDVIESTSTHGKSQTIKSHHNVGGLPERMLMKVLEPLRELFKDEVRALGRALGVPEAVLERHPFPGPGLAVRVVGEVTSERLEVLRRADRIFLDEVERAGLRRELAQVFAVLLPVRSVGVMGDGRTYEQVLALRAVTTSDFMTADWYRFPHDFLARVSTRIVGEVRGVNRVVYDITSKPPGTIEWE